MIACAVIIAIDLTAIAMRRARYSGDFDISMEFGRRFVAGEHLYRGGLHFPYLPAAAMFFAPFAMLPKPLAFALFYCMAIACLWLTMRMLAAMASDVHPNLRERTWPIAAATLILASHYIIRDLDDAGPNLVLLALAMAGIHYARAGRETAAAAYFGAAAAFKATAALFIPFLIWKRRFRLAIFTMIGTGLWIGLPALRMGGANWWAHQREWLRSAAGFAAGYNAAAAHYYGAGNVGNQALRAAVSYLLITRLRVGPGAAHTAGVAAAAALMGIFGALTVRPYDRLRWLRESGGLLIVALLLSPIAWIQHLVLAIPAIYLISAGYFAGEHFGPLPAAAMTLYAVLALILNRAVLGKVRYETLLKYHAQTLCMLLVLAVLMLTREASALPARRRRPNDAIIEAAD